MGRVFKLMARFGAPGGTARWVIRWYSTLQLSLPNEPMHALLEPMVRARTRVLPNAKRDTILLDRVRSVNSLMELTLELLRSESGLLDLEPKHFCDVLEVVAEELRKSQIPKSVLFGEREDMQYFTKRIHS